MTAPFTPEQEARIAELAERAAVKVAVAVAERQAQKSAAAVVDRIRVSEDELKERLSGADQDRFL